MTNVTSHYSKNYKLNELNKVKSYNINILNQFYSYYIHHMSDISHNIDRI